MMLCELLTVKTRLGIAEADVVDDAILTNAILAIGGRFELECNRKFERTANATFEFRADEMDILVDRYPIEDYSAFHVKANETAGWVLQADVVALIGLKKNIIELSTALGTSREIARVTFDGGYVLPGGTVSAGQTALPDELAQACVEQTAHWYQQRKHLGLASVSGEGGSFSKDPVSVVTPLSLLPAVLAVLKKYERWRM